MKRNERLEQLLILYKIPYTYDYDEEKGGLYCIQLGEETHFVCAEAVPHYIWDALSPLAQTLRE